MEPLPSKFAWMWAGAALVNVGIGKHAAEWTKGSQEHVIGTLRAEKKHDRRVLVRFPDGTKGEYGTAALAAKAVLRFSEEGEPPEPLPPSPAAPHLATSENLSLPEPGPEARLTDGSEP